MTRTGLVLTALLMAAAGAAAQSGESDLETIYNYHKIDDGLTTSGQIAYDQITSLKEAGFEVVINLATASNGANALEGYLVTEAGLSYVHIPVSWSEPSIRDLQMFFDVMEANKDRKVFVHCFANMRVSAFVYLYRTLIEGVGDAEARADLTEIWEPNDLDQWRQLIESAQASYGTN